MIKNCDRCGIRYKDWDWCLEYTNVTNDLTKYKCLYYKKNYQKTISISLFCCEKMFTDMNT